VGRCSQIGLRNQRLSRRTKGDSCFGMSPIMQSYGTPVCRNSATRQLEVGAAAEPDGRVDHVPGEPAVGP